MPSIWSVSPSAVTSFIPGVSAVVSTDARTAFTQVNDKSRILLRATADAWMQVKDRSGNVLLNRILKAGETWQVPRQDNLLLTTGNAGGTEIVIDGNTTPSLGGAGAVRRDIMLDPTTLSSGVSAGKAATPPVQFTVMRGHQ